MNRPASHSGQTAPLALKVGAALLALAYLLPGHYLPWTAFQSQWLAAFALMPWALGLMQRAASAPRLPLPALAALAGALALAPALQWVLGLLPFASDALLAALYLLALALTIVAGAAPLPDQRAQFLRWLLGALMVASAVSVALALVQWLQLGSFVFIADLRPGGRPYANLAQPNHLATLLGLGVVGVLYLYQTAMLGGAAASALLAWFGLGLVMTQSRTGWLSMALLALWCLTHGRRWAPRVRPAAVMVAAALFAMAIVGWRPLNEWLLLSTAPLQERLTPGTRWLHWRALWQAAWLEPWTGYGWQQVTVAQQRTALDFRPSGEMIQNSHNLLLDLLLWNGVALGALVALCLVVWFVRRVRGVRDVDDFVLVAAVGVIGVHALLEYPLDYTYFLLPVGLLIGLLNGPTPLRLARGLFVTVLAALGVMLVWIGAEYLRVEQANRDVRLMLAGFGRDKVPNVPPPDVRLLDGPREYHRFMLTPARPGMSTAEIDWMRRVTQRNAYPPAMMRFALAAGLNGHGEEAALTLQRLCHIHPPARCEEARESWRAAQSKFAVLASIPAP